MFDFMDLPDCINLVHIHNRYPYPSPSLLDGLKYQQRIFFCKNRTSARDLAINSSMAISGIDWDDVIFRKRPTT